jgi:ribosome-associated protein
MIRITDSIAIDEAEIELRFVRSAGPGGQNVNKVATAVQLRFDVAHSPSLPGPVRERLARLSGRRMSADGVLIITAQRFRTQGRNREDAIERLMALVRQAAVIPRQRKPTRPSGAERRRRLENKRHRSEIKRSRRAKADFT